MPENKQNNLETLEAFSPIVKSLAAVGFGVFGDSPRSRGIATGLARSAQKDINVRAALDEARREKVLADIKARQEKTKQALALMWKTAQSIESLTARAKYLDLGVDLGDGQKSYWEHAGIARPESLGSDPVTLEFNTKELIDILDDENSPYNDFTIAIVKGHLANAENLADTDPHGARVEYDKAVAVMNDLPEKKTYFSSDGTRVFDTAKNAFDSGHVFKSHAAAMNAKSTEQYDKAVSPLKTALNKITDRFYNQKTNSWGEPVKMDYGKLFMDGGAISRKMNALAAGLDSPPILNMNIPFPEILQDSYDWEAAFTFIRNMVTSGSELDFNDYDVLHDTLYANKETIWHMSEKKRSEDGGYKSKDVTRKPSSTEKTPPTKAAPPSDRVATAVAQLQGADPSVKPAVRKRLKDKGYTPSEIKSVFERLGW